MGRDGIGGGMGFFNLDGRMIPMAADVPFTMQDVESSQIKRLGYNPGTRQLRVQFKKFDGSPGATYEYENVDSETYNGFFAKGEDDKPISIGRYFGLTIKADPRKFPYKKLDK
jgi:hypothetical protein